MGLQGMINDLVEKCDFPTGTHLNGELEKLPKKDAGAIATLISAAENHPKREAGAFFDEGSCSDKEM